MIWPIIKKVSNLNIIPIIGNCLYDLKRFQEAITMYDVTIKLNPKYVLAYYNKGLNQINIII